MAKGKDTGASKSATVPSTRSDPSTKEQDSTTANAPLSKLFGLIPIGQLQVTLFAVLLPLLITGAALSRAFFIRLQPIKEYGFVIHEFDPWFNFRATQYLADNGWSAFFSWFDYMSWYPLGRPVGTTIYPGLQITAVGLWRALGAAGVELSLNDTCVLIPAWFGSVSTLALALITYEVSQSLVATAISAYLFAIVPGHLMRSMAGEYDNECIAMAAMLLTFYFWIRSIRCPRSWPIGVLAGLAYGYMVAAWGGYIFVLNMVALHAAVTTVVDTLRNRYDPGLVKAYALFYVVGTAIATRVPPVGLTPFRSLEQLLALVVFLFMGALRVSEVFRVRAEVEVLSRRAFKIRLRACAAMVAALVLFSTVLAPSGYFGPLSSRVRALFVQHTRTGNPLVDSVAEHQPARQNAYWHYLNLCYPLWLFGTLFVMLLFVFNRSRANAITFVVLYSAASYYFSTRMARLMLLASPISTLTAGFLVSLPLRWAANQLFWDPSESFRGSPRASAGKKSAPVNVGRKATPSKSCKEGSSEEFVEELKLYINQFPIMLRLSLSVAVFAMILLNPGWLSFVSSSKNAAMGLANPRLMFQVGHPDGSVVMVRDYLDAYDYLRTETPEDARVLAWWDYGYQITGIGNRTSLADGNTWNHEHIATIGKMLTSPVKEAHSLIRHVADYVLIWARRSGDIGKSPHMARIGNSVYRDICPGDPRCSQFGFLDGELKKPTRMMRQSLLFHLHELGQRPDVELNPSMFREVYTSQYGLVRIYKVMNVDQQSKKWIADPANRVCNPPGSWQCRGQYPPAKEFQDMLAKRIDFSQLEDFNRVRQAEKN